MEPLDIQYDPMEVHPSLILRLERAIQEELEREVFLKSGRAGRLTVSIGRECLVYRRTNQPLEVEDMLQAIRTSLAVKAE